MASHARPQQSRISRGLLRAGLAVSVAGAALAAGAPTAGAADDGKSDPASLEDIKAAGNAAVGALQQATTGGLGAAKNLHLNPLSGTGSDPLDNTIGTQIADFKPISTAPLTAPLTHGAALTDLPVVGPVAQQLPG